MQVFLQIRHQIYHLRQVQLNGKLHSQLKLNGSELLSFIKAVDSMVIIRSGMLNRKHRNNQYTNYIILSSVRLCSTVLGENLYIISATEAGYPTA